MTSTTSIAKAADIAALAGFAPDSPDLIKNPLTPRLIHYCSSRGTVGPKIREAAQLAKVRIEEGQCVLHAGDEFYPLDEHTRYAMFPAFFLQHWRQVKPNDLSLIRTSLSPKTGEAIQGTQTKWDEAALWLGVVLNPPVKDALPVTVVSVFAGPKVNFATQFYDKLKAAQSSPKIPVAFSNTATQLLFNKPGKTGLAYVKAEARVRPTTQEDAALFKSWMASKTSQEEFEKALATFNELKNEILAKQVK